MGNSTQNQIGENTKSIHGLMKISMVLQLECNLWKFIGWQQAIPSAYSPCGKPQCLLLSLSNYERLSDLSVCVNIVRKW